MKNREGQDIYYLSYEDTVILMSTRMAKVLDVIEDITKNNGVSTLICYPLEEE